MEIKTARVGGVFLGVIVAGMATLALGCPVLSANYFSDQLGNGGGMTTAATTTGTGGAAPCSSMSPCKDDNNPCTMNACVNGFCAYDPLTMAVGPGSDPCTTIACDKGVPTPEVHDGAPCGKGLKCVGAVCSGCTVHADCGTTDECQTSTCLANKTCEYAFQPIGTKVVNGKLPGDLSGDCMSTICNGSGTAVLFADGTDVPDDSKDCTDGHCVDGKPEQTPSAIGAPCSDPSMFCSSAQSCVACSIDANCPMGKTCYALSECVSCTDAKKNGDETDIDCGGACGATCKDGKDCKDAGDCENNLCAGGKCIGCFDGIKNNGEAGADCGGPCALKCPDATPCMKASDCINGQCADGVCCNTACSGTCTACNIPMKEGICSQLAKGHDDSNPVCSSNKTCDTGVCKSDGNLGHFGETCSNASQCFSGVCVGVPLACN